jgi:hypothetical protein
MCFFLSFNREFRCKFILWILLKDIEYFEVQKTTLLLSWLMEDVATIPDLLSEFFQRRQSLSTFGRPLSSFAQPEDVLNAAPPSAADVREPLRDDEMRRPTMEGFERRKAQLIIKSAQILTRFDRRSFDAAERNAAASKEEERCQRSECWDRSFFNQRVLRLPLLRGTTAPTIDSF